MNTCIFVVIATVIIKTSAQGLPYFLSSTGPNSVNSSDYDGNDIFKDDEVVEYRVNESDKIDTIHNKSLETSQLPSIPSSKPTSSKHFDVIESDKIEEIHNKSLETSQRLSIPSSKATSFKHFDFDDWDLMNENETTLYDEFNQTILNEMKQYKTYGLKFVITVKPDLLTTPSKTLELDPDIFKSEENEISPTTTVEIVNAPHDAATLELDFEIFGTEEPEIPTSTPTPAHPTTPTLEFVLDFFEPEETEPPTTTPIPTTMQVTTESVNSTEVTDYIENEIEPGTDDFDYVNEMMKDPCNYEKFPHEIPTVEKTGRRVSDIKCEEYMWYYKLEVLDVEKKKKECKEKMKKEKQNLTEIFGGFKALQGDFPHMGAVGWILQTGDIKWMCGSSLISPWFTLTAAHCRKAPKSFKLHRKNREPELVRFGSVFLDNKIIETRNLLAEDVYIAEFLVLDEYAENPTKKYNDIALIRLKTEVKMKLFIKPACLWTQFPSLGNSWAANITGWGRTSYAQASGSNYLKYAEVDYVEQSTCRRYIHGRRNRHWPEGLKDHQMCAGKLQGGIDACQGDSGGPLQIRSPMPAAMNSSGEVHHVVGITSFGIKCGYPFLPGVYTNVASFLCWIEKTVWPEENNPFCP